MLLFGKKGHLTTRGSPIKYGDQILRLLVAVHLSAKVSISHCKRHQKGSLEVARGTQAADQAAKRAELQNHDLIGIATLVPQTNLPETPSYTEGETLKAKSEGFQEDHRLLPCPGYDKQCCDEHWGARVSFRSGFLGVYAQKWDCWVLWQFYFQFFKESPHSSP